MTYPEAAAVAARVAAVGGVTRWCVWQLITTRQWYVTAWTETGYTFTVWSVADWEDRIQDMHRHPVYYWEFSPECRTGMLAV